MTLRGTALIALLAIALAASVVWCRPPAPERVAERAAEVTPPSSPGLPVVLAAEHALESFWWQADGHLLLLTPEELVDVNPDQPLPARRVPLRHGRRLRGATDGTFLVEREDGWETRDAVTLARLASGDGRTALALSDDGRYLATATDHFAVFDLRTGEALAQMPAPSGHDAGSPGSFTFLSGGAPGSAWAALLSAGELTLVDFRDGTVHLRRKLRRLTEDGRSRELLELRGKHAYLTSAYGFEVVDLPRGLTLVRERDPQEGADVTFTVSDDGATVTEASTFAETLVTSWDVPVGASTARSSLPEQTPRSTNENESPDHRYLANLHAGALSLVSLRSGAEVWHLGPPGDAPVDMFRRLVLVHGVPVLRERRGRELPLSRETPIGADDRADAGAEPSPPPAGMLLATQDARFLYFVGTEHDDGAAALLPVLRVERRTGESVPLFAAQRSALARFADHTVEIFGDESEAQASILCATETSWLPAVSCLNLFVVEGRFDAARAPLPARSGDHPSERIR